MEQRDIIKDQIEQVGKAIGKLISKFLNLGPTGNINEAIELTNHQLKDELDIDVEVLLHLEKEALKEFASNKHFAEKSLETLSDYFRKIGEDKAEVFPQEAIRYFQKAIQFLELSDEVSQMYSFDRMEKRKEIKKLQQLM